MRVHSSQQTDHGKIHSKTDQKMEKFENISHERKNAIFSSSFDCNQSIDQSRL